LWFGMGNCGVQWLLAHAACALAAIQYVVGAGWWLALKMVLLQGYNASCF